MEQILGMIGGAGGGGAAGAVGGLGQLMSMFKKFDKNGDGQFASEDLKLGHLGAPLISMMFRQIDTNRNGRLDFNEILKVFELMGKAGHLAQGGMGGLRQPR